MRYFCIIGISVLIMLLAQSGLTKDTGFLFVSSDPLGARLVIDGNSDRELFTPMLCTLSVGQHQLQLYMENYRPETTLVQIRSGEVTRREFTFVHRGQIQAQPAQQSSVFNEQGTLTILTDLPGASLWVDGVLMEELTPVTLANVQAGLRYLTVDLNGLLFDTTVNITPGELTLLEINLSQLLGEIDGERRVTLEYEIEFPGCQYRRDPDKEPENSNIALRGVDVMIQVVADSQKVEFSHRTLGRDEQFDHRGFPTQKMVPDTVLIGTLVLKAADSIRIGVRVYVNDGRRFKDRDGLDSEIKSYVIPGDFNRGEPIRLRLKVTDKGVISFRYF